MAKGQIIGGEDIVMEPTEEGGALLLKGFGAAPGKIWDIKDTTLADGHAPKRHLRQELEKGSVDMGGGFLMKETPVLVQRDWTGAITRTTDLNEIPGVSFGPSGVQLEGYEEQQESITPAPLSRDNRRKLVYILAKRLMDHYRNTLASPKYNPLRDGLPVLPSGSPQHLKPLPGTTLYPASDSQVMDWLTKFVGDRATVYNKNRFGRDHLEDLALRIE